MYRLGHRKTHHYVIGGGLLIIVASLAVTGAILSGKIFQAHTVLRQSPPITHTVLGDTTQTQQVSKGPFIFDIPADWHEVEAPRVPYAVYSWAGTTKLSAAQRLDIYIDNVPLDMAVNRLQPVQANGDHLDIVGPTSDNCTSFTTRVPTSVNTGYAPSKWNGVNFLCDMANYERDVVATGSAGPINATTLVGSTSGSHHVLLVYTDHNLSPDFITFVSIIKSFHLI